MRASLFALAMAAGALGLAPLSAADAAKAPATINVTVPVGATLTIDGQETKANGHHRSFTTPPLEHGHYYYYNLKASFDRNGKTFTIAKKVRVRPGRRSVVSLDLARTQYNPTIGYFAPADAGGVIDPATPDLDDDADLYNP